MDIPNLIDYMLVNFYIGNVDWDHNNWYGGRRRVGGGFQFLNWDSERTFLSLSDNVTGKDNDNQPTSVHQRLAANADYRMLFADHAHRHFFNGGTLTVESAKARWLGRADEIGLALVAESARWGDAKRPENPYTPEVEWQAELDYLCEEYFPQRSDIVLGQLRARGLYPNVAAPTFSVQGGAVPTGYPLVMTAPAGVIWYTTDGSDPRLPEAPQGETGQVTLVPEEAPKRVAVPTEDIGSAWREVLGFDDTDWSVIEGQPGGVGYERNAGYEGYISGDVHDAMYGSHTTCFLRIPFDIAVLDEHWNTMALGMRYDDGFIVYLNGVEIARRNVEGDPAWDSQAPTGHSDADAVHLERIDVSSFLELLEPGGNLLAIHGLNNSPTSSDFLISAELSVAMGGGSAGVADVASVYRRPVLLGRTVCVRARVLNGGMWSALNGAVFAVGPVVESLRITEIMYHPAAKEGQAEPDTEFVEVANVGDVALDLNLVRFCEGIDFVFGPMELQPGQATVVVQDSHAFRAYYGDDVHVAGQYAGRLDNGGERLRLEDAVGRTVVDFRYDDKWHRSTDGGGFSLTLVDPMSTEAGDMNQPDVWRPSFDPGGSPGDEPFSLGAR
jgi:hypothetical protein